MARLTIGDLAKGTGTKIETIRYYERIGLLPVPEGNYRSYDEAQFGRLRFIRRARDLGFSLEQVRELLELGDEQSRSCEAVDTIARQHLIEVDRKISDLTALRERLADVIDQCGQGTIAECRVIEALAHAGV